MKVRYFCELYYCDDPKNPACLKRTATLVDDEPVKKEWYTQKFTSEMARENALTRPYHTYLLSALDTDFIENRFGICDMVLAKIESIERGEVDEYMYEGQGFMHIIRLDGVTFEHMIFGECYSWPRWTCPMAHYKAALKGWRRFLDMPESIDSELIIELPEANEKVSAD
jgi:hypothetical protein